MKYTTELVYRDTEKHITLATQKLEKTFSTTKKAYEFLCNRVSGMKCVSSEALNFNIFGRVYDDQNKEVETYALF